VDVRPQIDFKGISKICQYIIFMDSVEVNLYFIVMESFFKVMLFQSPAR